ncbi:hypothetical protein RDI58_024440 [Solanum bulbocastanum]|uniref:Uncharacterized protein n=1 Tax=Solanum bulbocastanum TaxID=147425 RepID=A0AAN8T307_SOLBU
MDLGDTFDHVNIER